MARKKFAIGGVSFFSFQDIITCISGILVLIVLVLSLKLIDQVVVKSDAADAQGIVVADLKASIASATRSMEEIDAELTRLDQVLKDRQQVSPNELKRQLSFASSQKAILQAKLESAQQTAGQLETKQTQQQEKLNDQGQHRLREKMLLEQQIADVQKSLKDLQTSGKIYGLPRGETKNGWLCLLRFSRIDIVPLAESHKSVVQTYSSSAEFQRLFLSTHPSDYFLFVITPGGIEKWDEIFDTLRTGHYDYGFDPAADDVVIRGLEASP